MRLIPIVRSSVVPIPQQSLSFSYRMVLTQARLARYPDDFMPSINDLINVITNICQ